MMRHIIILITAGTLYKAHNLVITLRLMSDALNNVRKY